MASVLSEAHQRLCLTDPALLELEEGGDIANEFLVRTPEDASNQIFVVAGQREAE
jgi:hypothetical protein